MAAAPSTALFLTLLVLFVIGWIGITHFILDMAGWPALERRFPERRDQPWLTLRGRSGQMGARVNFNGVLTLAAGPAGLRIAVSRLFALRSQPITVPWDQIDAAPESRFGLPMVRLSFGRPEIGRLTIEARLWQRLSERAPLADRLAPPPASAAARAYLGSWLGLTVLTGTFFAVVSRGAPGPGLPLVLAYGLPAATLGVLLAVRYLRD